MTRRSGASNTGRDIAKRAREIDGDLRDIEAAAAKRRSDMP
jgi:hypothetical protein